MPHDSPIRCFHQGEFTAEATVKMSPDGRYLVRFRLKCVDCQEYMKFFGLPKGIDLNGARVSEDGKELRAAIGTDQTLAYFYEQAVNGIPNNKLIKKEFKPVLVNAQIKKAV